MPEKLKKGWARVAFGDVVRQVRDRVDPENTDIKRYIAGGHMDTDDLRIRRWGLIGDGYLGPAFNMRFKPGHVLYGSRRTYLRKVAVADFEGITANTTFVIETKDPKVLLPELLPFIMQTETFHEHSIKQSKGSVNPYINFSDLTWYEFALPPLEEQRRITEVLICFEEARNRLAALRNSQILLMHSLFHGMCSRDLHRKEGPIVRFCQFVTDGDHNPPPRVQKGIPHLVVANLREGRIVETGCTYITAGDYERVKKRYSPQGGDVLLTCVGSIGQVAIVPYNYVFSADRSLAIYRPLSSVLLPEFCLWMLRSKASQDYFNAVATGTAQLHLYLGDLRRQPVQVPSMDVQKDIVQHMNRTDEKLTATGQREGEIAALRAAVLCMVENGWY